MIHAHSKQPQIIIFSTNTSPWNKHSSITPILMFDTIISHYLQKYHNPPQQKNNLINPKPPEPPPPKPTTYKLYYRNQYCPNYKMDDRFLKQIINNNIICTQPHETKQLVPYYKSNTITSLIIKNNQCPSTPTLKKNLICKFTCTHCDYKHQSNTYIGLATTSLSSWLTMHLSSWAPKQHTFDTHKIKLDRATIVQNTSIIRSESDPYRRSILEALYIKKFTLPSTSKSLPLIEPWNFTIPNTSYPPATCLHYLSRPLSPLYFTSYADSPFNR